jgi:hypothetical protein
MSSSIIAGKIKRVTIKNIVKRNIAEKPLSPMFLSILSALSIIITSAGIAIADNYQNSVNNKDLNLLSRLTKSGFIKNEGQWDKRARYLAQFPGMNVWLTDDGILFDKYEVRSHGSSFAPGVVPDSLEITGFVVKMSFAGGATHLNYRHEQLFDTKAKYTYIQNVVNNSNSGFSRAIDASASKEIRLLSVYEGVDMRFYEEQGSVRYDFIVKPNADAKRINIAFEGMNSISIDNNGNIVLQSIAGEQKHGSLLAYQMSKGKKKVVGCSFKKNIDGTIGLQLQNYDRTKELIIDPLVYSSYLGSAMNDRAYGMDIDTSGNIYLTGSTYSPSFPTTTGAYSTVYDASGDVFVSKINAAGTALIYSTFIGGSGIDRANTIAVDNAGCAYVAGYTNSTNFPTTAGVIQPSNGGDFDGFVLKLNSYGSNLLYSSYLGGSLFDQVTVLRLGSSGYAYIAGHSLSSNFPTTAGVVKPYYSGASETSDCFVAKIDQSCSSLLFSTYYGGSQSDKINDLRIDSNGNIIFAGSTSSYDLPVSSNACYTYYGGGNSDGFIVKLNSAATSTTYCTFLGGANSDEVTAICLDESGNVYATGTTWSVNYPTTQGAYSTSYSLGCDAFLTKLNPDGTALVYSSFLGGASLDAGRAISLDRTNAAIISGQTYSLDFPILNSIQGENNGNGDAFVTVFTQNGSQIKHSSIFGGSGQEYLTNGICDANGNVTLSGFTSSDDYSATAGALQIANAGNDDIFCFKLGVPSIYTQTVKDTLKQNETFFVRFLAQSSYGEGNQFIAQLSDSSGSFAQPVNIGSLTLSTPVENGTLIDSVLAQIPESVTFGRHYRVRVVSTMPEVVGENNGNDITIILPFSLAATNFIQVESGTALWADFDNDGRLDLFLCGNVAEGSIPLPETKIYRNTEDGLNDSGAEMNGIMYSSAVAADFDKDGRLDLAVCGLNGNGEFAAVYKNKGNFQFENVGAGLQIMQRGDIQTIDVNQDGYLDIIMCGYAGTAQNSFTKLYVNNGDMTFTERTTALPAVSFGSLAVSDYDLDGDDDILITGLIGNTRIARLYRNNGDGSFTNANAGFSGTSYSRAIWTDFNGDGREDVVITGWNGFYQVMNIYRNNANNTFTNVNSTLQGVTYGSISAGDYNNDNLPDILITGVTPSGRFTSVYKNNGNFAFSSLNSGIDSLLNSFAAFGDFNSDNRLDVFICGTNGSNKVAQLFLNNDTTSKILPSAPQGLSATVTGDSCYFQWEHNLPVGSYSYNISVGTDSLSSDVLPCNSMLPFGTRTLAQKGNVSRRNFVSLRGLQPGEYYWRLQTVDAGLTGSEFSHASSFIIPDTLYLPLRQGWSMVSSWLEPQETNMDVLNQQLDGNLLIAKNGIGEFYIPGHPSSNMTEWDYSCGKILYMTNADTLMLVGPRIKGEEHPLFLNTGWTMIPYYSKYESEIETTFSMLNRLILAKDVFGNAFIPFYGVDQIGTLKPGYAYWVYVCLPDTLVYHSQSALQQRISDWDDTGNAAFSRECEYFKTIERTGLDNAHIYLELASFLSDAEVGVFSADGQLLGSAAICNGKAIITVWSGSPDNPAENAAQSGELNLFVYDRNGKKVYKLEDYLCADMLTGETSNKIDFSVGGFWKIDALLKDYSNNEDDIQLTTDANSLQISFSATDADECMLELFDLGGSRLYFNTFSIINSMYNTISIDLTGFSHGAYSLILSLDGRKLRKVFVF